MQIQFKNSAKCDKESQLGKVIEITAASLMEASHLCTYTITNIQHILLHILPLERFFIMFQTINA